jgi:hypothetical protein
VRPVLKDHQASQVLLELLVLLDHKVVPVLQVQLDHRVLPGLPAPQVHAVLAPLDRKVLRDLPGLPAPQVLMDPQVPQVHKAHPVLPV